MYLFYWNELLVTLVVVSLISILVSAVIFNMMPLDQATTGRIGALFGASTSQVDIELALNPQLATAVVAKEETGLLAILPTNIFAALTSNDSLRVIIFAAIFGTGMVLIERRAGTSIFNVLEHIQAVCAMIFEWLHVLTPIGIVALIAPQIALVGPEIYVILAPFVMAFFVTSVLLMVLPILAVLMVLRLRPGLVFAQMLKPMVLAFATKNTLVCIPAALDALTKELPGPRKSCELYIPLGFTIMRFGPMVYFAIGALFIGYLMGHTFSFFDLVLVSVLSIVASFASIGSKGLAGLAPLAIVLRPFGLSYELALPLMVIVDPIANMIRIMLNVALNCHIPVLAAGRELDEDSITAVATK